MKLPISRFLPKKIKPEYILALLLRDEKASAVIVEQFQGKIKIIGQHTEYLSPSLEEIPTDELLDVLDKTISRAEETLPSNVETRKTVFGVKDEWVEEKKIKKEHLSQLKKVSDALDLIPIGFLVVSEAVAHLIQEEEGAPLSAILAEVGVRDVNLVLFRGGKIVDSQMGPIEESPIHTVDTLLKHFTIEVLPSRLIVFGGQDDHALVQKFISHPWSKSLPFLHVPQISVLPDNFDARSIVFGAATQMGLEVLGEVVDKTASEIKTYDHAAKEPTSVLPVDSSLADEVKEENQAMTEHPTIPPPLEPDLQTPSPTDTKNEKKVDTHPTPLGGDNFGFVSEEDIANIRPPEETTPAHHHASRTSLQDTDTDSDRGEVETPSILTKIRESVMTGVGSLGRLPILLHRILKPAAHLRGNKIVLIVIIAIVLLVAGSTLYVMNVRGTVTISLNPKVIEKSEIVTISPDAINDFSKQTLQATAISSTIEGTLTTPATGKKDVGEKAKGTVTLYNNNDSKKTLSAGTVITSSNSLDFILDKDISVASASGDAFTGTKPGTAQAAVSAKAIGTEYNLPSNAKFSISSASNVVAKNDSAFSGGSKKQVTVISKKDIDKLLAELPKSLEEKARTDLGTKVDEGDSLLPGFTESSVVSKTFDKKVDEEAKALTLKGKVTFESLTYKNKDLQDFATSILKSKYVQDLHVSDKGVTTELSATKKIDTETFEVTVGIKANLLPTLDTASIQKRITGVSVKDALTYLNTLPQISSSQITLSPPIPLIPQFLPRLSDHISLEVKTNE